MLPEPALVRVWKTHGIDERLTVYLFKEVLISCRLVCRSLADQLAPYLFSEITITFRSRTLTRPTRLLAHKRIGKYIQTLTFKIPHTAETFLPPIIDLATGTEQTFVYMPQRHQTFPESPKYGNWQMTDLLVKQYPPLFHAATDVPSFVCAFSTMTNLRHLKINCEGQHPSHRYRRSVVDYALISLRIAVENNGKTSRNMRAHSTCPLYSVPRESVSNSCRKSFVPCRSRRMDCGTWRRHERERGSGVGLLI